MAASSTRVPVSYRNAAASPSQRRQLPKLKLSFPEVGVVIGVALIILMMVAVPLRNYFQGRTEIARVSQAIVEKQAEKEQLSQELERYQSDAYVREQARQRLGVIAPGETAYRIVDPTSTEDSAAQQDATSDLPWYEILWDSISTPPSSEPTAPLVEGEIDTNMPLQ